MCLEDLFSIEEYKSEGPKQAPNTSSITSYLEDLYEDSNILRRHKTCTVSEVLFLRHLELAAEGEGKYFSYSAPILALCMNLPCIILR